RGDHRRRVYADPRQQHDLKRRPAIGVFPPELRHLVAVGVNPNTAARFLPYLSSAMSEFDITSGERPAMFLAQVAHESGGFQFLSELWGPTTAQSRYPDGPEWKGHGLIQITGLANHKAEASYFGVPLDRVIEWLTSPEGACRSAAHFWSAHGCNALADAYDFIGVTRRINGGLNGLADRTARYEALSAVSTDRV